MQIVIDIPEKIIKDAKDSPNYYPTYYFDKIWRAIVNGTPLPKGHGKLKDMNDIYEALEGWSNDTGWIVDAIDFQTQTIIEAERIGER